MYKMYRHSIHLTPPPLGDVQQFPESMNGGTTATGRAQRIEHPSGVELGEDASRRGGGDVRQVGKGRGPEDGVLEQELHRQWGVLGSRPVGHVDEHAAPASVSVQEGMDMRQGQLDELVHGVGVEDEWRTSKVVDHILCFMINKRIRRS